MSNEKITPVFGATGAQGESFTPDMPTSEYIVLTPKEGLRLESGPGRDLIFKVTGEDTGGAFDYFIVDVAPAAACAP